MCGFSDVRRDVDGYYCQICGQRMKDDYERVIRLSLPARYWEQLKRQCRAASNGSAVRNALGKSGD